MTKSASSKLVIEYSLTNVPQMTSDELEDLVYGKTIDEIIDADFDFNGEALPFIDEDGVCECVITYDGSIFCGVDERKMPMRAFYPNSDHVIEDESGLFARWMTETEIEEADNKVYGGDWP